jgi:hypothetical protein
MAAPAKYAEIAWKKDKKEMTTKFLFYKHIKERHWYPQGFLWEVQLYFLPKLH